MISPGELPLHCVIYSRVSSDRQRDARTIESQRDQLQAYAHEQGWTVVAVEEDDGVSGDVDPWERPAMARVLDMVVREAVDVVLVVDVDRVSRDSDNIAFALVRKELRDHKVRLATPRGILDFESPEARLSQDILAALASFQRHKIKRTTTRGRRKSLRDGGRPIAHIPLGYGWSQELGEVVVVEAEAAVVREVYRLAAEDGLSPRAIATTLRRAGTKSGRLVKGATNYLAANTIRRMIKRELYGNGDYRPCPKAMPELVRVVTPIVSSEVWSAANATLGRRSKTYTRKVNYPFLLRGYVRCAHCGRAMRAQGVSKGRYPYYRCPKAEVPAINGERCTNNRAARAQEVDILVWEIVACFIREPGALRAEVERMVEDQLPEGERPANVLRRADDAVAKLDDERVRLIRLFRKDLISESELEGELQDIERQKSVHHQRRELVMLRQRTAEERTARFQAVEERLAAMRDVVDELSAEERRAVIEEMVDEVKIDGVNQRVEVRGILLSASTEGTPDGGPGGGGRRQSQKNAGRTVPGVYGVELSPPTA